MKYIRILACCLLSTASLLGEITLLGEVPVDIELEIFEHPVVIKNNYLIDDERAPFWWGAYNASMNFKEFDRYEDWINYFSDAYISQFAITEDKFIQSKAIPLTDLAIVSERSALYGVRFKMNDREIYVLKLVDESLDEFSGSLDDYDGFSVTEIFEKTDGVWKNQTPDAIGSLLFFPYNDIAATKDVINSPVAILDKATGVFIPKVTEAAEELKRKISP